MHQVFRACQVRVYGGLDLKWIRGPRKGRGWMGLYSYLIPATSFLLIFHLSGSSPTLAELLSLVVVFFLELKQVTEDLSLSECSSAERS